MESFGKGGKISSLRKALYKVKGQTRVKGVKRRQKKKNNNNNEGEE